MVEPMRAGEAIVVIVVILIVFSAARMGTLGNAIGRFVYSFKKAARGHDLVDAPRVARKLERLAEEDAKLDPPDKT
jgi:sec-independent protein translocase protein TatA